MRLGDHRLAYRVAGLAVAGHRRPVGGHRLGHPAVASSARLPAVPCAGPRSTPVSSDSGVPRVERVQHPLQIVAALRAPLLLGQVQQLLRAGVRRASAPAPRAAATTAARPPVGRAARGRRSPRAAGAPRSARPTAVRPIRSLWPMVPLRASKRAASPVARSRQLVGERRHGHLAGRPVPHQPGGAASGHRARPRSAAAAAAPPRRRTASRRPATAPGPASPGAARRSPGRGPRCRSGAQNSTWSPMSPRSARFAAQPPVRPPVRVARPRRSRPVRRYGSSSAVRIACGCSAQVSRPASTGSASATASSSPPQVGEVARLRRRVAAGAVGEVVAGRGAPQLVPAPRRRRRRRRGGPPGAAACTPPAGCARRPGSGVPCRRAPRTSGPAAPRGSSAAPLTMYLKCQSSVCA